MSNLLEIKNLLEDSKQFRKKLVDEMDQLESKKIDCKKCSGVCCTVNRNSMQVTPIEALDLYFEIQTQISDQESFWMHNHETIHLYGLNREIYVKGKLLRKNYTCPLFKFESWGCPIDKYLKPLGCLGYNALVTDISAGENCASNIKLLDEVHENIKTEWSELNNKLKNLLQFNFDKTSIPVALENLKVILKN